ncbi:Hsp20/alpha crystallin family protein [Candidatus Peregrinibacteria bacterium]|nr:Hsp20/alpha crystallin family protein [Candidatus Peregrinibacteria bacterium]
MNSSSIKIHPIGSQDAKPLKKEVGQLSVDIYHTNNEIVILAPIAGVDKNDIHISITDDVLVIKGERPAVEEPPEEAYYTRECFWGSFSRSIVLPLEADSKKISASFEKNVLEIRIPKTEVEKTKIIKIKS